MASSPYRTQARREPPPAAPPLPRETWIVAAFVWLVTLARVLVSLIHDETLSREVVFAWLLLIVVPVVVGREIDRCYRRA
jgi:hypothetical protein